MKDILFGTRHKLETRLPFFAEYFVYGPVLGPNFWAMALCSHGEEKEKLFGFLVAI